ncbi:hypothetical protein HY256_04805 [Candidatus Sumerlaeota bacterium]|nr:hypothetical protein [Candidatus Sumerlaeota bacterium]
MAADGLGHWIAVWYSFDDFGGTIGNEDNDELYSYSWDGGASWSPNAPLNPWAYTDGPYKDNDQIPSIATDGKGVWLATWYSDYGSSQLFEFDIYVSKSTDNGLSWSNPVYVNRNHATDSGPDGGPQIATDRMGHWLIVWMSDENLDNQIGTDRDILYATSTDDGDSWTSPVWLNSFATTDAGADWSPQAATDGNGLWICAWASNSNPSGLTGNDFDVFYAKSVDNGQTWSAAQPLNSEAATDIGDDGETGIGLGRTGPQIATDRSGHWVVVWPYVNSLGGLSGTDEDLLYSYSTDNGNTWSSQAWLNSNALVDIAEPGLPSYYPVDHGARLATDCKGNWIVVWDSSKYFQAPNYNQDILISRSINNGASWSPEQPLNLNYACDNGNDMNAGLATDEDGHWIVVWASTDTAFGGGGTPVSDYDIVYSVSSNLDAPDPADGALLIGHTIPPFMPPGQSLNAAITLRNSGNTTWTAETCYAFQILDDPCGLFSAGGATTGTLGLAPGESVPPKTNRDFLCYITAPTTPTLCTARLQMYHAGVGSFGPEIDIAVNVAAPVNAIKDWQLYE